MSSNTIAQNTEGIKSPSLGYLVITPEGPFEGVRRACRELHLHKTTLLRRLESERYPGWYAITTDLPLQPDETCLTCTVIDNLMFREGLWVIAINHEHSDTHLDTGCISIKYSYQGVDYETTLESWLNETSPHKENIINGNT